MPQRPPAHCTVAGCPHPSFTGGPCPTHAHTRARQRGSATAQGYGGDWPERAARYLTWHPVCALCGGPSAIADHWPRSRRQLVRDGVTDPNADRYLRPLCQPCHRRQSGLRQPGGWNAQRL